MNPASIMKMMKEKNTFIANHPKFVSFYSMHSAAASRQTLLLKSQLQSLDRSL